MIRDVRAGTAFFLAIAALTLPPMAQAVILVAAWMLPHLVPSVFTPVTPQRQFAWTRFQPFAVVFVILSVLMQGIFGPEPHLKDPLLPLSAEGMEFGLIVSLRAVLVLTGVLVMTMPMPPLELAHVLSYLRLPVGIPVAILLSLQLVEDLPDIVRRIRRAQHSRGVRLDGSFFVRLKAARYLITPVVMRSLEGSLERASALQLRGLLNPIPFTRSAARYNAFSILLFGLAIILLLIRSFQWLGLLPSIG